MRHWKYVVWMALSLGVSVPNGFPGEAPTSRHASLASIRLHNPTGWEGATCVEVPTGSLATPGLIDWTRVRLVADDGRDVPYAIREGRPHWRARLATPVVGPRAEDLLVFDCPVRPGGWVRLDVEPGTPATGSAIGDDKGRLVVSYPGLRATVDPTTAMLVSVEAAGEPLLLAPLSVAFRKTAGSAGPARPLGAPRVRPVSRSSSAAMTELHYVLDVSDRLSMGVTYRVHRAGLVEIEIDERPWEGVSPWLDHAAKIALRLAGEPETLPELVDRAPFYGFKDYAAAVKYAARVHRRPGGAVVELGEETINGRRWVRRLHVVPVADMSRVADLIKLASEGLVVEVMPRTLVLPGQELAITCPPGAEVPARRIGDAIETRGMRARSETGVVSPGTVVVGLRLVDTAQAPGITGDGFEINATEGGRGVTVTACTRFGLMQAACRVSNHLRAAAGPLALPLIAGNPAARLRGAGFGGGDVEVDFPYGTDAEWHQALDQLVASGMNVMADLGMWSDWKMPVSYREMPELRSSAADAYDEVSGAKFSEFARHRDRALGLLDFLHRRGVKVWLWLPTGCVPTTYARQHPEALAPKNDRCPCFTHPLYTRYLEALLKELLETYPIDGIVMIRDDNGGLCACERCKDFVARSSTQSAAWEQYLILYRWLKSSGFKGDIAVYPYFDSYEPRLDPLLPDDLLIVGHGSGAGMLARNYETLAPMGDTWLDNVFVGFRLPTTARMKRLLDGRNSFWLGGALRGNEGPWHTLGRFGWEPTATVNTLRHEWGVGLAVHDRAPALVALLDAYESLWELYDLPMLPQEWVKLGPERRQQAASLGRARLDRFRRELETCCAEPSHAADPDRVAWTGHLRLFATYFEYHLRRLELIAQMQELAVANRPKLSGREGLAPSDRERFLAMNHEIDRMADRFDHEMAAVPGNMLAHTRAARLTAPYREFVNGYDALEWHLDVKQFAGELAVSAGAARPGEPLALRVEFQNRGLAAWTPGAGPQLQIGGDGQRLGLPSRHDFDGTPMVFGDRRVIELKGMLPVPPGEAKLEVSVIAPFRNAQPFMRQERTIRWSETPRRPSPAGGGHGSKPVPGAAGPP